jgi:hypothetical protein
LPKAAAFQQLAASQAHIVVSGKTGEALIHQALDIGEKKLQQIKLFIFLWF